LLNARAGKEAGRRFYRTSAPPKKTSRQICRNRADSGKNNRRFCRNRPLQEKLMAGRLQTANGLAQPAPKMHGIYKFAGKKSEA